MKDTWRPIESAPRNGILIDLWAGGDRVTDCKWMSDGFYYYECDQDGCEWVNVKQWHGTPTHWRPKPGPPTDAK